jgi:hypothetical protein
MSSTVEAEVDRMLKEFMDKVFPETKEPTDKLESE